MSRAGPLVFAACATIPLVRRALVTCCLSALACAPVAASEPAAEPTLETFEPDEAREDELVARAPPDPIPSPPIRPKIDARWADADAVDTDCLLEPNHPGCGPLLPAETIREVVRAELPAIRACWTDTDDVPPGPPNLRFRIARDGSVTDVHLREDLPEELDACLRRSIGALQFPELARDGSVVVSYPWR